MNWFAAKPQATVLERTWLTGSAKLAGVIVQVREICAASRALPILAHFDDAREDVKAVLNQAGIPHVELDRLITPTQLPSLLGSSVRVVVGSTKFLNVETVGAINEGVSEPLDIVVVERYPLAGRDQDVVTFGQQCGPHCRVSFHSALGDAVMAAFVNSGVRETLVSLGMKDSESSAGGMIGRTIRKGQTQVSRRYTSDPDTQSAHDWFDKARRASISEHTDSTQQFAINILVRIVGISTPVLLSRKTSGSAGGLTEFDSSGIV